MSEYDCGDVDEMIVISSKAKLSLLSNEALYDKTNKDNDE